MIKKIIFSIFLLLFLACSKNKQRNTIFEDTYIDILTKEIFKFRDIRPPTPEEFKKGITDHLPSIRDTLPPLKLYVQRKHLEINFNEFNIKLPEDFMFAFDTAKETVSLLPKNIERYSTKKYEFIGFNNLDNVFNKNDFTNINFGGALQFSEVLINKKYNRALLFVRDSRDSLDSIERLILLEKAGDTWKVLKSIVISFS